MPKTLFKYYQPNLKDRKDEYGDCVIRALTKALNKTWLEVFDELVPISRELQIPFNCKPCYEQYLEKYQGYKFVGYKAKRGVRRPTVKDFVKNTKKGTYILRVVHHLVTVVDGQYFDTWDSGECCYYGYWVKE